MLILVLFVVSCGNAKDNLNIDNQTKIDSTSTHNKIINIIPDTNYFKQVKIDSSGAIFWTLKSKDNASSYLIEEFRWNKWHTINQIPNQNREFYKFQIDTSCGLYKTRIKAITENTPLYSSEVEFPTRQTIRILQKCKGSSIEFNRKTKYQIYSHDGKLIKEDCALFVNINQFDKGIYYILYGNSIENFIKK